MTKETAYHERQTFKGAHLQDPYYDPHHDPYFVKEKYRDGSVCNGCGVLFEKGHFVWPSQPAAAENEITCPACKRTEDGP